MTDVFLLDAIQIAAECPRRVENPTPADWSRVEREFGRHFPTSFKNFLESFGSGIFGDITVLNPAGSNSFRLSARRLEEFRRDWLALRGVGVPIFPEPNGFVIVAVTNSNIVYALQPERCQLNEALFRLDLSAHSHRALGMPLAEFLVRAYQGDLRESFREEIWGYFPYFFEPKS